MVDGHGLDLARHVFQFDRACGVAVRGDHDAVLAPGDEVGGGGAEPGGPDAVGGGGRAATLQMAEDGDAGIEAGELFELLGEDQGAVGVDDFGFFSVGFLGLLALFLMGRVLQR